MAEEKVNTGVVDVDSPESVFKELRGEISRITILRDGKVLDRVLPEEVDDDPVFWTKERYGGGKYQMILFGKDGKVKKRLSFVIDGLPKHPGEEKVGEEGTLKLVEKLIEKLEEKRGSSSGELTAVFQMMLQMQQQQFELLLQTLKSERKESSFLEKFIDKVLSNPAILMSAGGGLWKLLQKALSNKNELLELIKVAKADPELKELAIQAVGAKYGAGGGIIDRIVSNPELLNKTLELVNKALTLREAGQNPLPTVKQELRKLAGAPRREATVSGTGNSPVNNPQSTATNVVDNQEVIEVQEIIAVGTKILDLAERGANAQQIWEALNDREVDVLIAVTDEYGIEDAEGLVNFLEKLPVPRFTVAGYIEAIRRHKAIIDELISFLGIEEVEESSQEGNQEGLQVPEKAESGQGKRETTGNLSGESQANHRQVTGEG